MFTRAAANNATGLGIAGVELDFRHIRKLVDVGGAFEAVARRQVRGVVLVDGPSAIELQVARVPLATVELVESGTSVRFIGWPRRARHADRDGHDMCQGPISIERVVTRTSEDIIVRAQGHQQREARRAKTR